MSGEPARVLPVLQTVGRAHMMVLRNAKHFLAAAGPPVLLMAAISFLHARLPEMTYRLEVVGSLALFTVPTALFSLRWLKRILPGKLPSGGPARRWTGSSMGRYAMHSLPWLMALILSPVVAILLTAFGFQLASRIWGVNLLPQSMPTTAVLAAWGALLTLWYLLAGRLMPVLPAIAWGSGLSLRQTWRRTRSQGLRISATLFIASMSSVAIGIAALFLSSLLVVALMKGMGPDGPLPREWSAVRVVLYLTAIFFSTLGTALISSVLGLVHQQLYDLSGATDQRVLAAFD